MVQIPVNKFKYTFPNTNFIPVEGYENTFDLVHERNEFALQTLVLSADTNVLVGVGYVIDLNTVRVNLDPNKQYVVIVVA